MDVGERVQSSQAVVQDVLGERAQKMFQDFLEELVKLHKFVDIHVPLPSLPPLSLVELFVKRTVLKCLEAQYSV